MVLYLLGLHRKKSPKMIEEVFKVFEFSQDDLVYAAARPDLMCSPGDLFSLLGKIEKQENQERAIKGCLYSVQYKRTEYIDPLLKAFEDKQPLKHLKDAVIKEHSGWIIVG